jgi:hypothetical protein
MRAQNMKLALAVSLLLGSAMVQCKKGADALALANKVWTESLNDCQKFIELFDNTCYGNEIAKATTGKPAAWNFPKRSV